MNEIGANILLYRKIAGLTQRELAKRLNMAKSTISNYERGLRIPDLETLCAITRELNTEPAALIRSSSSVIDSPQDALWKNDLVAIFSQLTKENRDIILSLARQTVKGQQRK